MITHPVKSRHSGFTLLELVIAMLLMTILVGMIFKTSTSALALGNTIVETQNKEMLNQAFFELLERRFSSLPGNTRFELKSTDGGQQYLSDITLQKVPQSFNWGGGARIAKAVQISTVRKRSGFLDIVLRYYENEILEGSEANTGKSRTVGEEKPFAEITLLTDVAYFEWKALDGRSMEWQYDWDVQGRLPLQLELTMKIGKDGEEIRQIFWMPTKTNPETIVNAQAYQ
jgi:prepilin-type N-terminal cleavage/methylation domain-containing protein